MNAIPAQTATPVKSGSNKLGALETIRGLGAVIVLFDHVAAVFFPGALLGENSAAVLHPGETLFHHFPFLLLVSGQFAVSLFFVLSGFVLSARYLGPRAASDVELGGAVVKRTLRLAPMVLVCGFLGFALGKVGWLFHPEVGPLTGALWLKTQTPWLQSTSELFKQACVRPFATSAVFDPPLWTIGVELVGSFLVYFLLLFLRKSSWRWWIYAVGIVVFRSDYLVGFIVGVMMADAWLNLKGCARWAANPVGALGVGVLALWLGACPAATENLPAMPVEYRFLPALKFGQVGWPGLGAILLLAVVLGSPALRSALDNKLGRWLGAISYAVYATHFLTIWSVGCGSMLLLRGRVPEPLLLLVSALISVVAALLVAQIFRRLVDQPSINASNALGRRFEATIDRGANVPVRIP